MILKLGSIGPIDPCQWAILLIINCLPKVFFENFLNKIGGIEEKVYIKVGEDKVKGKPETDVDRTSEDGKASSVQFLHLNFSDEQIKKFKNTNITVTLGIEHDLYNHMTNIIGDIRLALISDFN